MTDWLHRSAPADLEIRGDGRTIVGIAMPFGVHTEIRGEGRPYTESFRRGAFARTIAERGNRVKAMVNHNYQSLPIGRASMLREDSVGLYAELRVSATSVGDEILALVRDGALDSLSIGFRPVKDAVKGGLVERTEVRLNEISVVGFPAYEGAAIAGVRSALPPSLSVDLASRRLDLLERL